MKHKHNQRYVINPQFVFLLSDVNNLRFNCLAHDYTYCEALLSFSFSIFVAKRCLSSRDVEYVIMAARLISVKMNRNCLEVSTR